MLSDIKTIQVCVIRHIEREETFNFIVAINSLTGIKIIDLSLSRSLFIYQCLSSLFATHTSQRQLDALFRKKIDKYVDF